MNNSGTTSLTLQNKIDDIKEDMMSLFKEYSRIAVQPTYQESVEFEKQMDEYGFYKEPVLDMEKTIEITEQTTKIWEARRISEELSILLFKMESIEHDI
jgi:hypothetical protein